MKSRLLNQKNVRFNLINFIFGFLLGTVLFGSIMSWGAAIVMPDSSAQSCTYVVCAYNAINEQNCDYIADGTNDEVQIQAAIDVIETDNVGGSVCLTNGAFYASQTITIEKSNITIRGIGDQGGGTIIIRANGAGNYGPTFLVADTDPVNNKIRWIKFADMNVKRAGVINTTDVHFRLRSAATIKFDNMRIQDAFGGIWIEGGVGVDITNTAFVATADQDVGSYHVKIAEGPFISDVNSYLVYINNASFSGASGITVDDAIIVNNIDALDITNSYFSAVEDSFLLLTPTNNRKIVTIRLKDSYMDGTYTNVAVKFVKITGTTTGGIGAIAIQNNQITGISPTPTNGIFNDSSSLKGLMISNNRFDGFGEHCINIQDGDSISIEGNDFGTCGENLTNTYNAINIGNSISDLKITENSVHIGSFRTPVTLAAGIAVGTGCTRCVIAPNHFGANITANYNLSSTPANVGDQIGVLPTQTNQSGKFLKTDGTNISWVGGIGDVVGPASSSDNSIVRFDGTTGKTIQNSTGISISDVGNLVLIQADAAPSISVYNTDSTAARNPTISLYNYIGSGATNGYPIAILYNYGGTSTSPSALPSGKNVGELRWAAYGTTATKLVARLLVTANANISDADQKVSLRFFTGSIGGNGTTTERLTIDGAGHTGIGVTSPTATLHLASGTATADTAPLKFNAGTKLTTKEAGAVEYVSTGDRLYFTDANYRKVLHGGGVPSLGSNCGTGASLQAGSSDTAGVITIGLVPGDTCTLTFSTAFTNSPVCVANLDVALALSVATTTTTLILGNTNLAQNYILHYICQGINE